MDQPRLTPTMSSRKAMVLDFVTAWIGAHPGSSPSLTMIGSGTGINKGHAAALVRQLIRDGKLQRRPGAARELVLPGEIERAVRVLRDAGVVVDDDFTRAGRAPPPLTFSTLPMLPPRGHSAGGGSGSDDGTAGAEQG